jgi:acetyl-CoA synthetase
MPSMTPAVAESAIVGFHMTRKYFVWFCNSKRNWNTEIENLSKEINQHISDHIGPIAKLDKIQFVSGLPKTRSGKIMRRILRKIAEGDYSNFGDTSTC